MLYVKKRTKLVMLVDATAIPFFCNIDDTIEAVRKFYLLSFTDDDADQL